MLRRVTQFPDKQVRDIALKVLRRNAFFAHPEHVIIAMLGDENKPVRDVRETLTASHTDTFEETSCEKVKTSEEVQGSIHKRKCNFVSPAR